MTSDKNGSWHGAPAKRLAAGIIGSGCILAALPAQADDAALQRKIEKLEAQIQLLQQSQQELKKEVADQGSFAAGAQAAAQRAEAAQQQAAEEVRKADWKGDLPGSFKIPGTSTSIKLGGRVKLDVSNDISGSLGGAVNDYSYVGQGNPASRRSGETQFTARASRLSLETLTQTDLLGPIKSYFEADFYGAGTDSTGPSRKNTNSGNFRIRQAYVQADDFLFGQTWSTFMDFPSSPELVDSIGGPPGANNGIRQPMIRYATKAGPGVVSAALESSVADFNGANQTQFGVGLSVPSNNSIDRVPDLVLKYEYRPSWGSLTGSAVGRWQTLDSNGEAANGRSYSADAFGYGVLLGGFVRPIEGYKSGLFFQALGGQGIGRYLGPTSSPTFEIGAMPSDSAKKLENLMAWGASIGAKVYWSDQFRSTFFYGHDHVANANGLLTNAAIVGQYRAIKNMDAFIANIMWSPFKDPNTYLGLEYTHAYVENYQMSSTAALSNNASADRLMGSVSFSF